MSKLKGLFVLTLFFGFSAHALANTISYSISGTLIKTSTGSDFYNLDGAHFRYTLTFDGNPTSYGSLDVNATYAEVTLSARPGFGDITTTVSSSSGSTPDLSLRNNYAPNGDTANFGGGRVDIFSPDSILDINGFLWTGSPDFWGVSESLTLPTSFTNTVNLGGFNWTGINQTVYSPTGLYLSISTRASMAPASPVPIPSAVWLFGSGLLGLVGVARRKRTV